MPIAGSNTASPDSVPAALATARVRRRDAERNRDRVLAAARRLVRDRGLAAVTMDDLAAEARVGKGTLYRGFGSRAGLAHALLDDAERRLQEQILTGPAPLGWGGPPDERLRAFVSAYLQLLAINVDLLIETERGSPGARFHTGTYAFWHTHITGLLRATARHRGDAAVRAHAVLALLAADLHRHLHDERTDTKQVEAVILDLIR
jgi:AcrR family transcriptional regulator